MNRYIFIVSLIVFTAAAVSAEGVKESDLAGSWYPASREELSSSIEAYLRDAKPERIDGAPFAVISPHAGYRFSGPVAGYSFKTVQGKDIKTVIIIGFSHRKFFDGISVYSSSAWRTPLGDIAVDERLAGDIIAKSPKIRFEPRLFEEENSVELQVPFVQAAFKNARIVPIAFGKQSFDDAKVLADALAQVLKGRSDCLIVASTDMSHYHPYDEANEIDRHAIDLLAKMSARELYDEAKLGICELCGIMPVVSTLLTAKELGYDKIKVLKYANSGDTTGSRENVVGYLSAVIYRGEPEAESRKPKAESRKPEAGEEKSEDAAQKEEGEAAMLNEAQRKRLLEIAKDSITSYVRNGKRERFTEDDPVLRKEMGAFVTLHEAGELRGCIGNMAAQGPLYQTVADMAIEAATGDPRFRPLSAAELDRIDIEISVLSPLKRVSGHEEVKVPGHGVLVRRSFRSGVYLPQVATETGWNKEEFLTSLCAHKAGMSPDAWRDPATEIYVFTAEVFGEKGGRS